VEGVSDSVVGQTGLKAQILALMMVTIIIMMMMEDFFPLKR
jgi:hypothetical protein